MLSEKQLQRVNETISSFQLDLKKYIIKENFAHKKGILTIAKEIGVGPDIMKNIVKFYDITPFHKIIEKNPVNEDDVVFLYTEKKMSVANIAFMMNSGEKEIEKILNENNISKRVPLSDEISRDDVQYLYEERGLQLKDIAKIMDCSRACITNYCKKNGIQKYNLYDDIEKDDVLFLHYDKKFSLNEIAYMMECPPSFLSTFCKKNDIEVNNGKYYFFYEDLQFLNDEKKLTPREIGELMNADKTTIEKWLKKFELNSNFEKANSSLLERKFQDFVLRLYDGEVIINCRKTIPPYELDIFVPDKNIAFEFNGIYWHNEIHKPKDYHKIKTDLCNNKNIKLIHLWEDDFVYYEERTMKFIKSFFEPPKKVQARKTKVFLVPANISADLLERNHIQGATRFSVSYGLLYENNLISCMTFIKDKDNWILNRYVNEYGYSVIGGFKKLLVSFIRNYHPKKIVSFADLSWVSPTDNVYTRNGFVKEYEVPVDYKYIYKGKRVHKFNFRHKFLDKKLEIYDKNLSERENMLNNNIYRIFDSGKIKYSYVCH